MGLDLNLVLSNERHYNEYICNICQQLTSLDSLVTTNCSHVFCRRCLEQEEHPQVCRNCNGSAGSYVLLAQSQPLAFRVLKNIKIACPLRKHHGCAWMGSYGDLASHMEHRHSIPFGGGGLGDHGGKRQTSPMPTTKSRNYSSQQQRTPVDPARDDDDYNNNNSKGFNIQVSPKRQQQPMPQNYTSNPRGRQQSNPRPTTNQQQMRDKSNRQQRQRTSKQSKSMGSSSSSFETNIRNRFSVTPTPADRAKATEKNKTTPPTSATSTNNGDEEGENDEESARLVSMVWKDKGNRSFRNGDYESALQLYTRALDYVLTSTTKGDQNWNDNYDDRTFLSSLYTNRAAALLRLHQWRRCIEDCTQAIELNPLTPKAYMRKAWAHVELGELDEACSILTEGVRQNPSVSELDAELTNIKELQQKTKTLDEYRARGEHKAALELIATLKNPNKDKKLLLWSAEAHMGMMNPTKAIERVTRLLSLDERHVDALQLRAKAHFWAAQLDDAIKDCEMAASIYPGNRALQTLLQRIQHVKQGLSAARDNDESIDAYTNIIEHETDAEELPPETPLIHSVRLERAEVHLKQSNFDGVLADVDVVLEEGNGRNAQAWKLKIQARKGNTQYKQLLEELKDIIENSIWGDKQAFLKAARDEVQAKLASRPRREFYDIFDVDQDSPIQVIRKAYRKKCKQYHPDRLVHQNLTPQEQREAEDMFKQITDAMDFLSNPEWRKMYNQGHDPHNIRQAALHNKQPAPART